MCGYPRFPIVFHTCRTCTCARIPQDTPGYPRIPQGNGAGYPADTPRYLCEIEENVPTSPFFKRTETIRTCLNQTGANFSVRLLQRPTMKDSEPAPSSDLRRGNGAGYLADTPRYPCEIGGGVPTRPFFKRTETIRTSLNQTGASLSVRLLQRPTMKDSEQASKQAKSKRPSNQPTKRRASNQATYQPTSW